MRTRRAGPGFSAVARSSFGAVVLGAVVLGAVVLGAVLAPCTLAAHEGDAAAGSFVARAPAPKLPVLTWEAPHECPDAATVSTRLAELLEGELGEVGEGYRIQGRVSSVGNDPWRLVLTLRQPSGAGEAAPRERVLFAERCDDLAEAAAVAVAIALGEERDASAAATNAPAASRAAASTDAASTDAASSDDPSAAARAPRDALSSGPSAGTPDDTGSSAKLGSAGLELEPVELSAGAVLDSASVSGLGFGLFADARAWLGPLGLGLYGLWLAPNEAVIGPGQSAEFSLLAGGGRACHGLVGRDARFRLNACASFELGRFGADSNGLIEATRVHDWWLAPGLGVDVAARLSSGLGLASRLELLVPLRRQVYRVDGVQPVHDIPALTLRWSLGLGGEVALR